MLCAVRGTARYTPQHTSEAKIKVIYNNVNVDLFCCFFFTYGVLMYVRIQEPSTLLVAYGK